MIIIKTPQPTIIIETPAPPVRERLVLVPLDACNEVREDDPRTKLGAKVGLTVLGTHARDATPADLERAGYAPRAMLTPDERTLCAESELDAEREETRHLRIRLSEQYERAEKAERERDDARRLHSAAEAQVACRSELRTRAYAAERERDTLRAELARLTAPVEGEPTPGQLLDACPPSGGVERLLSCYRLGVAHERARLAAAGVTVATAEDAARFEVVQPVPRATDEELRDLYESAWDACPGNAGESKLAAIRAVAAHVRKERCLVAQAVGTNVDIRVCEDDGGGFMVGVHAPGCDEDLERNVPAADVPATLARLLGEVSRG